MSAIDYDRERRTLRTTDFIVGLICGTAVGAVLGTMIAAMPDAASGATYTSGADATAGATNRSHEALRSGPGRFDDLRAPYLDAPRLASGARDARRT